MAFVYQRWTFAVECVYLANRENVFCRAIRFGT